MDNTIETNNEENHGLLRFHLNTYSASDNDSDSFLSLNARERYLYTGLDILQQDVEINLSDKIHICPYYVNTSGKLPFLEFILKKQDSDNNDMLTFPCFYNTPELPITEYSNVMLEMIYHSYKLTLGTYEYKGGIKREKNVYLFYDFSSCNIGVHELYRNNDAWLVTMDEIMNHTHVCNFPIDPNVTDFFVDHIELVYLRDNNNVIIEIPTIGYNGAVAKKVDFMLYFGVTASEQEYLESPHFYFTDFQHSIKNAKVDYQNEVLKDRYLDAKCGIVRSVLFLGNMKFYTNREDAGQSDYDSIYIGNNITNGPPIWGLTIKEQQCSI